MIPNKGWKLPKPPSSPEIKWHPVVRLGTFLPFGYYQDPDDEDILLPIPEELNLFEKAKLLVKEYSYNEVAEWLTQQTGRSITNNGLKQRIDIEEKRKKRASVANFYAKRYKEAKEKAEKLEAQIGGEATRSSSDTQGD